MKRINITHVAEATSVVSVLAIAAIAVTANARISATAEAAANVTDPSQLQQFAHVQVVNATPAQLAMLAAERTAPSAGMRAFVNPDTGTLRQPSVEELSFPAASASAAATPRRLASGALVANLDDSSQAYSVARREADGSITQACLEQQKNADVALAAIEAAPGVDRHEK